MNQWCVGAAQTPQEDEAARAEVGDNPSSQAQSRSQSVTSPPRTLRGTLFRGHRFGCAGHGHSAGCGNLCCFFLAR